MLICKNCGEANPAHATKCSHCLMPGNFDREKTAGPVEAPAKMERQQPDQCHNCGEELTENANFCTACAFPVAAQPKQPTNITGPAALKILRRSA